MILDHHILFSALYVTFYPIYVCADKCCSRLIDASILDAFRLAFDSDHMLCPMQTIEAGSLAATGAKIENRRSWRDRKIGLMPLIQLAFEIVSVRLAHYHIFVIIESAHIDT